MSLVLNCSGFRTQYWARTMQRLRMTYDLCHVLGQWQADIPKGHRRKAPFGLFIFIVSLSVRLISVKSVIGDNYENMWRKSKFG